MPPSRERVGEPPAERRPGRRLPATAPWIGPYAARRPAARMAPGTTASILTGCSLTIARIREPSPAGLRGTAPSRMDPGTQGARGAYPQTSVLWPSTGGAARITYNPHVTAADIHLRCQRCGTDMDLARPRAGIALGSPDQFWVCPPSRGLDISGRPTPRRRRRCRPPSHRPGHRRKTLDYEPLSAEHFLTSTVELPTLGPVFKLSVRAR